uniref:Uncharacterized protein n=1 Tax=Tanacetum cinerariifolium TaxID=118510 RepID=A0A6L2NTT4_TANCI|nr:hypothetical protein [Tanacetum cinerariifolium]
MSTPTFAKTHNLIAFLEKHLESDGFKQIVDFLNANQIKYALTVSLTIYTSCIKQIWTIVKIKAVNDDVWLQALNDGKKVVINEASIRHDLKLNDAEGTSCLSNDVIFEELARMGVEFPTINETVVDMEESSKQGMKIADIDANAEVNLENMYNLDKAHEEIVLSIQDVDVQSKRIEDVVKEVAEEMVEVMEIAKIIVDEVNTAGGELNAANEKPAELNADMKDNIDWNKVVEQVQSRQSDDVRKYQALKRKPVSLAQARKNMMIYLKNMAGFKIVFFKGMSYEEIRPLFEEEYNKRKTRKDCGMRRGCSFTSSSSAFGQPSSSHLKDVDNDGVDEGTSRARTPFPTHFANSLTNERKTRKDCGMRRGCSFTSFSSAFGQPSSSHLKDVDNDGVDEGTSRARTPSPTHFANSLTNEISLSLSPITPLDHILDTPSPPSPQPQPQPTLMGHPIYFNTLDYHRVNYHCCFQNRNLIFSLKDEMDLMFAHIEYLLTFAIASPSPPHP